MVSQCYDGAATMSGIKNGVQQKLKSLAPQAFFIWCCCHNLNLPLVSSAQQIRNIKIFFGIVQKIYTFITASPKRNTIFTGTQEGLKQVKRLKALSDTRWSSRSESLQAIYDLYPCIVKTLEIIQQTDNDALIASEADGLLNQILQDKFYLTATKKIFGFTNVLSKLLQSEDVDMVSAIKMIKTTIELLKEYREETKFEEIYLESTKLASTHSENNASAEESNIQEQQNVKKRKATTTVQTTRTSKRQKRVSVRIDDNPKTQHFFDEKSQQRVDYYEMIDFIINDMNERFSKAVIEIYECLQVLAIYRNDVYDEDKLKKICALLNHKLNDELITEFKLFNNNRYQYQ